MRYVIIRDDDTNALTPVECLERLYRPFLDRGLPVNLAAIPDVATNATMADGRPEGFLFKRNGTAALASENRSGGSSSDGRQGSKRGWEETVPSRFKTAMHDRLGQKTVTLPIGSNYQLVRYLLDNPGYHMLQHGYRHNYMEFDYPVRAEVAQWLEQGTRLLMEAGFPQPQTFVAPYDRLSRASLLEVARRFRVLSTGWYELRRLPRAWWPKYAIKKLRHAPHWQVGRTLLLSHPGCLLSCHRTYSTMLGGILHYLETQQLTVLVTHWWEYFRNHEPDEPFIEFLHETASYLATHPELKVISFSDLVNSRIPVN